MQFFASKEKIGTLTNLGASVQLGPSSVKIGGQMFRNTSNISVAYPALTANTLYMIYAVQSAGVVSIVISTNVNSVGPAGQTAWKLVGAFYSNGMSSVAFGDFVNIEGVPKTQAIPFALTVGAVTTPPTKASAPNVDLAKWWRVGSEIFFTYQYEHSVNTGSAAGSGEYHYPMATFTVDSTRLPIMNPARTVLGIAKLSSGSTGVGGATATGHLLLGTAQPNAFKLNYLVSAIETTVNQGSANYPYNGAFLSVSLQSFGVPMVGLSNTPLKDL